MGWRERLRLVLAASSPAEQAPPANLTSDPDGQFVVGIGDIDPALFGLPSWTTLAPLSPAPRVTREQALQVPAVKRARDIICATSGMLPPYVLDPANRRKTRALFDQPEEDVPRSVTMALTFEDMLFEGAAWWRILKLGWDGFPTRVRRLEARYVDVRRDQRVFVRPDGSSQGTATEHVPDDQLIRFDSPNEALLVAGARAIRTCLVLDSSAARYAEEPSMQGYFTPADGAAPPGDDDTVTKLLDDWKLARQARVTGYVPGSLKYNPIEAWAPKDMQLAEARQHAVLEIARLTGVDAEDLGVSTTSRTYANSVDRRLDRQDMTLGPYVTAWQDRASMADVTPLGTRVRLDFGGFTRSNEAERMATYQAAVDLGAYDLAEVQRREELPRSDPPRRPPPPAAPAPAPAADQPETAPEDTMANSTRGLSRLLFERADLSFEHPAVAQAFAVDAHARTITGMVVPYGAFAVKQGTRYTFAKGALKFTDPTRVKLQRDHERGSAIGFMVKATDTPAGVVATYKVARGPAGDEALSLAEDHVLDGLSVGIDWQPEGLQVQDDGSVLVLSAAWRETSLTSMPAFDDARVTGVKLTTDQKETSAMEDCPTCGGQHPPGPCPTPPTPPPTPPALPADAGVQLIADAIRAGFEALVPPGGRPVVPAGRLPLTVNEPPLYRFDGGPSQHCFSRDLIANLSKGDGEAGARVEQFMAEQFAVTQANVATLNPSRQRPDLYVDQAEFEYPIWDTINKGTLTDNTPFVLPKFGTASGLVGDHVAGVEPTGTGALTATSQTITPSALSGKTIVEREVWDQGGNPQLDGILWRQIVRAWFEGLEAFAVAQLNAAAATITDLTITTAAVNAALEASLTSQLAVLQYIRGGNRFRNFFVQVDLYKALIAAVDTNGRKLFPILNPQNATGTTDAFFADVMVGGLRARPAWALAPTGIVAASSWLFDREVISGWASAPRRITMDAIKVATVEIGVWGYKAFAITDATFIREVVYDPV